MFRGIAFEQTKNRSFVKGCVTYPSLISLLSLAAQASTVRSPSATDNIATDTEVQGGSSRSECHRIREYPQHPQICRATSNDPSGVQGEGGARIGKFGIVNTKR